MFFLGLLIGAALMLAVSNFARKLDEIKKWNDHESHA